MAADDVRSLHLTIGPDDYLDFHESRKAQLFGKFRVLRFYKHPDFAFRLRELSNLSPQRNCPANCRREYGEQTHYDYSLSLIHDLSLKPESPAK